MVLPRWHAASRMWRHEGKLTGLSARGEPTLADAIGKHFHLGADGLIEADFKSTRIMGEKDHRAMLAGMP